MKHMGRQWHLTPVLLPGKSHGWRSLEGCSLWGCWGSDTTERLHFHFSLSCIGEGNGNPLQCSCLENPRIGGAWWAAIYGVAQSRTRLKGLSSSSNVFSQSEHMHILCTLPGSQGLFMLHQASLPITRAINMLTKKNWLVLSGFFFFFLTFYEWKLSIYSLLTI